jgi:endonuclease/exonuclease/phosphatase family metal-dependent hydrolase
MLRIVSYNVRYFSHALRGLASTEKSMRGIAAALARLDPLPAIACLQEVETLSIRSRIAGGRGKPRVNQLEAFMAALEREFAAARRTMPYEAFYFRAHQYGSKRLPIYTTGLAILVDVSRLEIAGHNQDKPHPITHHHVERFKDQKQTRVCAHMRLTVAGRPFHVFNTHLSLPTPFAREFWTIRQKMGHGTNQLEEARTLAAFCHELAGQDPFIVCGDFNSAPSSPVYRYLTEGVGLTGAQHCLGLIDPDVTRGFPTAGLARLRMHLDHLFGSKGVRWLDMEGTCAFGDRTGAFHGLSDHVPLIARFDPLAE